MITPSSKLSKEQLDNVRRVVVDSSTGLIFQFSPQLVFNLFDQHRLHFMFINLSKNRLEIFHFYFRKDLEFKWTVSHLIVTKLNNNLILYCFSGKKSPLFPLWILSGYTRELANCMKADQESFNQVTNTIQTVQQTQYEITKNVDKKPRISEWTAL